MEKIYLTSEIMEFLEKVANEENTTVSMVLRGIVYREMERVDNLLNEV